jgi:hypothetical protein
MNAFHNEHVIEIDRLDATDLERQLGAYLRANRPVIFPVAERCSPEVTLETLQNSSGNKTLTVMISRDGNFPGGEHVIDGKNYQQVTMTLREFLRRLATPELDTPILGPGEKYYVYHQPDSILDFVTVNLAGLLPAGLKAVHKQYPDRGELSCASWISAAGNVTPVHTDLSFDNFLVNLTGHKELTLYAPNAENYEGLRIVPFGKRFSRQSLLDVAGSPEEKSQVTRSLFRWVGEIRSNEAIYIPHAWFHGVKSLAFSVSMNHWWPPDGEPLIELMHMKQKSPLAWARALRKAKQAHAHLAPNLQHIYSRLLRDGSLPYRVLGYFTA